MFRSKCVNKLLAGIANSCRFSIACHLHFNSAKKIEEKHIRIKFGFSSQYVSFDFALESTIKGIKIALFHDTNQLKEKERERERE